MQKSKPNVKVKPDYKQVKADFQETGEAPLPDKPQVLDKFARVIRQIDADCEKQLNWHIDRMKREGKRFQDHALRLFDANVRTRLKMDEICAFASTFGYYWCGVDPLTRHVNLIVDNHRFFFEICDKNQKPLKSESRVEIPEDIGYPLYHILELEGDHRLLTWCSITKCIQPHLQRYLAELSLSIKQNEPKPLQTTDKATAQQPAPILAQAEPESQTPRTPTDATNISNLKKMFLRENDYTVVCEYVGGEKEKYKLNAQLMTALIYLCTELKDKGSQPTKTEIYRKAGVSSKAHRDGSVRRWFISHKGKPKLFAEKFLAKDKDSRTPGGQPSCRIMVDTELIQIQNSDDSV